MSTRQPGAAPRIDPVVDERAIAAHPIEAVGADLRDLGIDPSAAIGLACRLAAEPRSPTALLLGKIEAAEAAERKAAELGAATSTHARARLWSEDSIAPDLARSDHQGERRGIAADSGWRIKPVDHGANGRGPRRPAGSAGPQGLAFERPRHESGAPDGRPPRTSVQRIARPSRLPMAMAASLALLLVGSAWIYAREHAQRSGGAGLVMADVQPTHVAAVPAQPPLVESPALSPKPGTDKAGALDAADAGVVASGTPLTDRLEYPLPFDQPSAAMASASTPAPAADAGDLPVPTTPVPSAPTTDAIDDNGSLAVAAVPPEPPRPAVQPLNRQSAAPLAPEALVTEARPRPVGITVVPALAAAHPEGSYRLQIAAVRAVAAARRTWELFRADLGPVLAGAQPFIERAETAYGVFYRVQIGPFMSFEEAHSLCDEIKRRNTSCFVIRR